jgi:hypothetical protein
MNKKVKILTAALGTMLFCGVTLAQEPVVNINKNVHSNLYQAQELIAKANQYIIAAQKDNRYDMKGEASKARQLLVEASQQLKAAAETANAAGAKKK